jgi:transposase-like protein
LKCQEQNTPICQITERILKSGIIRDKQRFYCKDCNYHFTLLHESKKQKSETKKNNRPTSLKDIAEVAGISISTVSRALKNHPDISILDHRTPDQQTNH